MAKSGGKKCLRTRRKVRFNSLLSAFKAQKALVNYLESSPLLRLHFYDLRRRVAIAALRCPVLYSLRQHALHGICAALAKLISPQT